MTEELERFKAAFGILHNHISAQIALGHLCGGAKSEAGQILQLAADTIHPPPKMEEVEVVRWMCASCEEVYDFKPITTNCGAKLDKHGGECEGTEYVKLTGTIRRPVKRPVVKEIVVRDASFILNTSAPGFTQKVVAPWRDDLPTGITGTLIFRYTE